MGETPGFDEEGLRAAVEAADGAQDEPLTDERPEVDSLLSALESRLSALDSRFAALESRKRWPRFVAALAAVLVVLVAAFAVGRATDSEGEATAQAAPIALPAASTTSSVPNTSTSTAPSPVSPSTTPPTVPPSTTASPPVSSTQPPPPLIPEIMSVAEIAVAVGPGVVQIETRSALGSGIVYDAEGFILTAAHVVDTTDDVVTVRLADGRAFDGVIVGAHAATDVAVIKIDPVEGLRTIELAPFDSLEIGEIAVALGSPFGLEQTVTAGIVSAVDRLVDGVVMVQTDAAINPGNSGGPLVDGLGRVIGINDQIFTLSGGNEGVGFAISIDLAIFIAEQIVAGDDIQLAFLGVTVSPSDGDPPGALVEQVVGGSAADTAGLQEGDLIVQADGRLIINSDALRARVIKKRPGATLTLEIVRDGELMVLEAILGATDA